MHLLIDAGNSRLKYGLHDGRQWILQNDTNGLAPELLLPDGLIPTGIVVSNVAGAAVGQQISKVIDSFAAPVEWLSASASRCGLINDYERPGALGSDRWAAAIAARRLTQSECLVVSCGTATTIDIVRADGHFAGGCILPGLQTMLDSLVRRTAGLPLSTGNLKLPPRNTHDAIATGCLLAQAGAIERMARLLGDGAQIILTGGNAERIKPHLQIAASLRPGLVLDGLLAVALDSSTS
ncbi:type III pantothenate kinase [Uliginosibacterium paludis]|uniref:Type III pantothenate kinase n=1 Tax=Uliginosibacterium paludis TaxID=1615952 RepID=A0ABV2CMX7_9RHOO